MKYRKLRIGTTPAASPEINVTPLVDVVLVLLIIFIVVTPFIQRQIPVSAPREQTVALPSQIPPSQLLLSVEADGGIDWNGVRVAQAELRTRIAQKLAVRKDKTVFFQADDAISYQLAVRVLDLAKAAGARPIGMITGASRGAK